MANQRPEKTEKEQRPPATHRTSGWSRALGAAGRVGRAAGKGSLRVLAVLGILIVLLVVASFFVDEPLRRSMERRMNHSLRGYSVRIPKLHFSLLGGSITLHDLTLRQRQNPEPPIAIFPTLKASVQWREILSLHLVADFLLDRPRIHVNRPQLDAESKDPTPVKEEGWRDAIDQIYPLKINLFRVNDGDVVYIDRDEKRPLHVAHLYLNASNIRNIHSREHVYPSPIHAEGVIFETGHGVLDGHADFLAKPFPGIHTLFRLEDVPLDQLRSMIARANLQLEGGKLATHGELEYGAKTKFARIEDLVVRGMRLDYVHTPATADAESARKDKVAAAAKKVSNRSDLTLRLDRLELSGCDVGMVNEAKDPAYRVFFANTNLVVTNLSNQFRGGPAVAKLTGRFMGSGPTRALAHFRPETNGPDFDLDAAIENTDMTKMNDLLRAYGKFDVTAGVFSFYTELKIKNGEITGYVKPLFKDVKVYDKRQDSDKSAFRKLYERLVGGVAKLLENRPRAEVATRADISGPVGEPKSSTWQVIGRLIENAFFRAILPGFDQEITPMGNGNREKRKS